MEEESLRRPPVAGFQCGERIETIKDKESVQSCVVFHCTLPPNGTSICQPSCLEFSCREPSCGALLPQEESATKEEEEEEEEEEYTVDPNFFDEGYTLAGRTGFQVWTGSRILVEALCWQKDDDCPRLRQVQEQVANGANILECGAGVGVVGMNLAAVGANVLMTDLTTLVDEALLPNQQRNQNTTSDNTNECPDWLEPNGVPVGKGWANATALDWKKPVSSQLSKHQIESIDLIVASDVVFLVEMLNALLDTVAAVFEQSTNNNISFILGFQRRDAKEGDDSECFTTVNRVLEEIRIRTWKAQCLAWRPVTVGEDASQVFVFGITPHGL